LRSADIAAAPETQGYGQGGYNVLAVERSSTSKALRASCTAKRGATRVLLEPRPSASF
jgi:hypothetical protein